MSAPAASFHPNPSKPKLELPRGACDTHFHVFGPQARFAFAPDRSCTPSGGAPKETLFKLHAHLGIERGVVVQSAVHGLSGGAPLSLSDFEASMLYPFQAFNYVAAPQT